MSAPNAREKLAYYTLGLTPPAEHADWVRKDVQSSWWLLRRAAQVLAGIVLGMWIAAVLVGYRRGLILGAVIGGVIGSVIQVVFMANFLRRRTLGYYEKKWAKQRV